MNNTDMPANPIALSSRHYNDGSITISSHDEYYEGITKREAFAMAAMQGFCTAVIQEDMLDVTMAKFSVEAADALLKELEK